jgi:hypothetical protein
MTETKGRSTAEDREIALNKLAEKIRKGEIHIGQLLVDEYKERRSMEQTLSELGRVKFPKDTEEKEAKALRDKMLLAFLKSPQGYTANEIRLATEAVPALIGKNEALIHSTDRLTNPSNPNDLRILQSLAGSREASSLTVEPILRESFQKASSMEGSDTDKIVALKANIKFLGQLRSLSNSALGYLQSVIESIEQNRQRLDDTKALRLFVAQHLDSNTPSGPSTGFNTPAGTYSRLPEGNLPNIQGQDKIQPDDSSNKGEVSGKRGIGTVPAPIPQRGVTVPTDSPRKLSEEDQSRYDTIGSLAYGLNSEDLESLYSLAVKLTLRSSPRQNRREATA